MTALVVPDSVAVMAVDPGKVTGVAGGYFNLKRASSTEAALKRAVRRKAFQVTQIEGEPEEQALDLHGMWERFEALANFERGVPKGCIYICFESFQLRQRDAELWPVEIKAGFRTLLWSRTRGLGVRYYEQTPSQAMGYATNARMKKWGVWTVGAEHGRDATRHVALMVSRALDGNLS